MVYNVYMRFDKMIIQWDYIKNDWLKSERDVTFEEVEMRLLEGDYLEIKPNPSSKYPYQYIVILIINDYTCVVPFVINEENNTIFLKTIYQSRKYKKALVNK